MDDGRDKATLLQIVELIGHIKRRFEELSLERFTNDPDEIDLTAFRLASIGEETRRLSPELRARHPQIRWSAIYGMRNVIAHEYGSIVPVRLWEAVKNELETLAEVCRAELSRLS